MYLDSSQNNVHNLVSDMQSAVELETRLKLVQLLGATFAKDGNMYCWTFGELPNDCVQGFGETPQKALYDFYNNFHSK